MLYIVCGGKGNLGCVQSNVSPRNVEGGYNGGGLGYWDGFKSGDGHSGVGSGGGATHIGKTNSLLSSTSKEDLYIVAGGGGGACVSGGWNNQGTWHLESSTGGSGGGLFGNGESGDARKSLGGTQSAGGSGNQGSGSYGQGSVRGGGGGLYGGGASYSIGGGGGSGYIEGVPNFIYVEGTEYKPETQNGVNEGNGRACITFVGTSEYEEKTVNTEYCYDRENKNLLASFSDEGEIVKYVYGNGLISSYTSGDDSAEEPAVSYYIYDLRGSAEHITDDEGDIVSTYAYSAYGQRTVESGTETPVGYCGRDGVLTEDNGLLYMRARYYAPSLRRFVNQDIVVGDISNSNSLNRYSYVEGNPVTMVDPFGLCGSKVMKSIGSIFTGMVGMATIKDIAIVSNEVRLSKYLKEIEVLEYSLDNVKKIVNPAEMSWGHFRRATRAELKTSQNLAKEYAKIGSELEKVSKATGAVSIVLDVAAGAYENYEKGASVDEYIVDGVTDVGISAAEIGLSMLAGFAFGGPVGAIVGLVSVYIVDIYEDKNGETLREKGKDCVYGFYKSISNKENK